MGSVTKRAKAPEASIVYVPVTATPATTATTTTSTPQTPAEQREESLLSRSRSRAGTILTSFRGILSPTEAGGNQRKTLLGE